MERTQAAPSSSQIGNACRLEPQAALALGKFGDAAATYAYEASDVVLQHCENLVSLLGVLRATSPSYMIYVLMYNYYDHACMHACTHSLTHSLIHSFIRSFIRSFVRSFIHSFVHTSVHTYICTLAYILTNYCIHTFIHACMQAGRQADRQTDRQDGQDRQMDGPTGVQTYRRT